MTLPKAGINDYANNVKLAGEVFAKYGEFICAVIRSQIKDKAKTDDIFQNFFLFLVYKPLPANLRNVKSYLYKAIINDIIDSTRKVDRYRALIGRYAERLDFPINRSGPENALIETEEAEKIFKLIEKHLPRSEARAITLRYMNDYSIKDVAEKMNVDGRTVSRYISVGLKKARQFLTIEQGE